ncbi:hypothetical protein ACFPOD_11590 [Nitratireductor kimnyeongensis]|uniref:Uncharacterized protein n=1 Tax=Nitratireductor kimnyeongensis TaxID=430679 RepID=A0ABW0T9D0_9HYPH
MQGIAGYGRVECTRQEHGFHAWPEFENAGGESVVIAQCNATTKGGLLGKPAEVDGDTARSERQTLDFCHQFIMSADRPSAFHDSSAQAVQRLGLLSA